MRYIIAAIALLSLAACDPTEEEKNNVRNKLPSGCYLTDLGTYGEIRRLIVVTCDNRKTTTANYIVPSGKSSYQLTSIIIE